jgi:transposase
MDGELFERWFEEMLMKEVGKGSVIVMDNAEFHRKARRDSGEVRVYRLFLITILA